MKCPYCGAETTGKVCEYCGSELPEETPTVEITNNYYGGETTRKSSNACCPKCGSTNISFDREKIGSTTYRKNRKGYSKRSSHSNSSTSYSYRNVGFCSDCGYSWNPNSSGNKFNFPLWVWIIGFCLCWPVALVALLYSKGVFDIKVPSFTVKGIEVASHTIGWYAIRILFWPIFLSIWFWKTDKLNLNKTKKIICLVALWIVIAGSSIAFCFTGDNATTNNNTATYSVTTTEVATIEEETTRKVSVVEAIKGTTEEETTEAETTTEKIVETTRSTSSSKIVYITSSGSRYHYSKSCAGKNAREVDISCVGSRTACKKCAS